MNEFYTPGRLQLEMTAGTQVLTVLKFSFNPVKSSIFVSINHTALNSKKKKRIIVSVTNDLVSDNRVHKVCNTLKTMGFEVLLTGRVLSGSLPIKERRYGTKRFRLIFNKGPLFYAEYNIRLFLFLLFSRYDVLLPNDLDTLCAHFLAAKITGKPLVYDSHEYFTHVPELINRPGVKRIWEWLEGIMVPGLNRAYTVNASIARMYKEKYGTHFEVVRNVPVARKKEIRTESNTDEKILLYQGAVNIGRGLAQAISSMEYLEGVRLLIAGDGDIKTELEKLVDDKNLHDKVEFLGRIPLEELHLVTEKADLGLSIEEDIGLNYRYALSNKLFDYIQAGVPVLATGLPEISAIVEQYGVGEITPSLEPEILAGRIKEMLFHPGGKERWRENLEKAAGELNWENEERIIKEIFRELL